MASATSLSSSTTLIHRPTSRPLPTAPVQCVSLPPLPAPAPPHNRVPITGVYCRKVARNIVAAMASDDSPVLIVEEEVVLPPPPPSEVTATESSELDILKTIQDAWDNLEDRYTVLALVVAVLVAISASSGMISAIDRLPLIPGVLELVGIGYTGWFAYRNLIFQANREALFRQINELYSEITGSS